MTQTASGTHTRIQMQRDGHALVPHGTLQTYDVSTGAFTALMDFQAQGEPAYVFTPASPVAGVFTDQNSLIWTLVR